MKEKRIRREAADLFNEEWSGLYKPSRDAGLRQLEKFLLVPLQYHLKEFRHPSI